MSDDEKRAAALEWLRKRGKHVLQVPHTRESHQAVQEAIQRDRKVPPKATKVHRIR